MRLVVAGNKRVRYDGYELYPGVGKEWDVFRGVHNLMKMRNKKNVDVTILAEYASNVGSNLNRVQDYYNKASAEFGKMFVEYDRVKRLVESDRLIHRPVKHSRFTYNEDLLCGLALMVNWDAKKSSIAKKLLKTMSHRTADSIVWKLVLLNKENHFKYMESIKNQDNGVLDAEVVRVMEYGAFISINGGERGFIHKTQIANAYIDSVYDWLYEGQKIKVVEINPDSQGRRQFSTRQINSVQRMVDTVVIDLPKGDINADKSKEVEVAKKEVEVAEVVHVDSQDKVVEKSTDQLIVEIFDNIDIIADYLELLKEQVGSLKAAISGDTKELVKKALAEMVGKL